MLAENHPYDLNPILQHYLSANLVSVNIVCAEPLHAEIINKSVSLYNLYLLCYLSIWNLLRNKSESHTKSVALKLA